MQSLDESQTERRTRTRREERTRSQARGEGFRASRNAQRSYEARLRRYARQIADIIRAFEENGIVPPERQPALIHALLLYKQASQPWAAGVAGRLIAEVDRRDLAAWQQYTAGMSAALRAELVRAPTGEAMRMLLATQVDLITSLPPDAGRRVHELTLQALERGSRYPDLKAEIAEALERAYPDTTEAWLLNRATLIARTETARTASVLTQARAEHVGAEEYVWRTAGDARVRPSHKRLNGTVHRWDEPPLSDPPDHHSHPGQIWNCRCVALPILPE